MLNYNSPINSTSTYSGLEISEVEPVIKLNLRGKKRDFITKVGKSLSIIPPIEPNTSSSNESSNVLWLSPDEWMVYENENNKSEENYYNLEDKLFNDISKLNLGSVVNVTDHWIMINLKGDKVFELLSTGCPFNFNNFRNSKGAVAQTIVNHVDVIIHNKNINDLNLFVRRSFSNHLWSWFNDSCRYL